MKAKILLTSVMILLITVTCGPNPVPTFTFTFTAVDNTTYVQLDSIKVVNRTQVADTVLYWPDTVLNLILVGIPEVDKKRAAFRVLQNYPNPVKDHTTISIYVPETDEVGVIITDVLGRILLKSERILQKGHHSYRFTPGTGNLFLLTAHWRRNVSSIRILHNDSDGDGDGSLEYISQQHSSPMIKETKVPQNFIFNIGDELLYIGYTNGLESGMLDVPEYIETYTFQFATNIPCPGTPTVEYEGQVYNTIQIFSQCWLKENLNIGTMIQGTEEMTDNDTIEKYCYNNDPDSCTKYGGLYQWYEMMQYTTQQGAQGICPQGWHLPTDEEWKILEGTVDSQYGVGDPEWDGDDLRGYDAGKNLKTTSGWYSNGNGTDLFGFSGLPGGLRYGYGYFDGVGSYGYWWTSTELNYYYAWSRILDYCYPDLYRYHSFKIFGYSVRCLRD